MTQIKKKKKRRRGITISQRYKKSEENTMNTFMPTIGKSRWNGQVSGNTHPPNIESERNRQSEQIKQNFRTGLFPASLGNSTKHIKKNQ